MSINPNSEDVQLNNLLNANKPYTFSVNRSTLVEQARQVWNDVADLEADFCPDNFAQASITMHPADSSRTDFPDKFLQHCGLFCVGTRKVSVFPRISMISDDPQEENSIAIIVLTKRQTYQALAGQLEKIEEPSLVGQQFMTIESIEAVTAYDRMNVPNDYFTNIYLVGLYVRPGMTVDESRKEFVEYAKKNGFEVNPDFNFEKDGLYYTLIKGERYKLDCISENPFVSCIEVPPLKA